MSASRIFSWRVALNFVAGKAAAVHVLDFVHQAALTGQAASNQ
jgi:hypothetical protein